MKFLFISVTSLHWSIKAEGTGISRYFIVYIEGILCQSVTSLSLLFVAQFIHHSSFFDYLPSQKSQISPRDFQGQI